MLFKPFFFFFQNDESSFVCISGALVIVQSFTYKMGSHRKKQVMTSDPPPPTDWKLHTSSIALSILSAAATCESRLGVGVSASGARPSKGTWVFSFPSLRRWWCAKINWPALSTPPHPHLRGNECTSCGDNTMLHGNTAPGYKNRKCTVGATISHSRTLMAMVTRLKWVLSRFQSCTLSNQRTWRNIKKIQWHGNNNDDKKDDRDRRQNNIGNLNKNDIKLQHQEHKEEEKNKKNNPRS